MFYLQSVSLARMLAMSGTSLPSPSSPQTTAPANKRYDRQVRLWGVHGQELLQAARICMLGAGPIATETLKNLVLGGIASFTLVDNKEVSERDLGNNFFFDRASLGRGRAEAATNLLRELNTSVKGSFSDCSVGDLLQEPDNFFQHFGLVIACEVRPHRPCAARLNACLHASCLPQIGFITRDWHAIPASHSVLRRLCAGDSEHGAANQRAVRGSRGDVHACPFLWSFWRSTGALHMRVLCFGRPGSVQRQQSTAYASLAARMRTQMPGADKHQLVWERLAVLLCTSSQQRHASGASVITMRLSVAELAAVT